METNNWQQSLDPVLVRRLMRPLRGGVIDNHLSRSIVGRIQRMAAASPLLSDLASRWANFVYYGAIPSPVVFAPHTPTTAHAHDVSRSTTQSGNRPIVLPKSRPSAQTASGTLPTVQPISRVASAVRRPPTPSISADTSTRVVRPAARMSPVHSPSGDAISRTTASQTSPESQQQDDEQAENRDDTGAKANESPAP
ncbi:MAG: hypothetical protein D6737_18600, partial [Chloroflexi bacterium]